MELLSAIPLIGGPLSVILPFLVVLAIVVAVHEYGHYIVGRWCGIDAEVFSIGFGPRLLSWHDKRGTRWQVAALPLGGFVKFVGDMDPASAGRVDDSELTERERAHAFHNASLWRRTLTVAAGPVFNFILSVVIFATLVLTAGQASDAPVVGDVRRDLSQQIALEPGDRILAVDGERVETFGDAISAFIAANGEEVSVRIDRDGETLTVPVSYRLAAKVDVVSPGMPASRSGMAPGDIITSVDGQPVASFRDLQLLTADKPLGAPIEITVERDGEERVFVIEPDVVERPHPVTGEVKPMPTIGVRAIGLGGIEPTMESAGIGTALTSGVGQTVTIITGTVNYLGDLIFGNADTSQLGGPIRIAQISGDKAAEGSFSFFFLVAVISTSIGLLNLFPIPVLDGGHLMFYAVEAIRGRPVGDAAIRIGTFIGLSLVLLLMVFATYNDLIRL